VIGDTQSRHSGACYIQADRHLRSYELTLLAIDAANWGLPLFG